LAQSTAQLDCISTLAPESSMLFEADSWIYFRRILSNEIRLKGWCLIINMRTKSMASEIDLLKEDIPIPRLEKKFGVDNPFVEVLKAQLASLQNQRKLQPQRGWYHRGFVNFKRFQIRKRNESFDIQL
jgi:hypothetical protein